MIKVTKSFLPGVLAIVFACCLPIFAQQAPSTVQPALTQPDQTNPPSTQSLKIESGQKRQMEFTVRELGSVTGRVAHESVANNGIGLQGIKVSLRSRDKGFELFVIEQFTDEEGKYTFEHLPPGKYVIEIDSTNLTPEAPTSVQTEATRADGSGPANVIPAKVEAAAVPETGSRVIHGTVFVDKNADGRFQPGKDQPVKGAHVVSQGHFTVTDANGGYTLKDMPTGRVGVLVSPPHRSESVHVVLDLGEGPGTNRTVNIPMGW